MHLLASLNGRYQDCFPHGYYFLSFKVANTVVGATAVNTLVSQVTATARHLSSTFT